MDSVAVYAATHDAFLLIEPGPRDVPTIATVAELDDALCWAKDHPQGLVLVVQVAAMDRTWN